MKKILFFLTILVISSVQLNAIELKYINENTQRLTIKRDTVISETIEIENNLVVQGESTILVNNNGIIIHIDPKLFFENKAKIIVNGTVILRNINIPQLSRIKSEIITFIPRTKSIHTF